MIIYGIFLGILSRMAWEDGRKNVIRSSTLWIYSVVGIVTAAIRQIWMQESLPWMDMATLAFYYASEESDAAGNGRRGYMDTHGTADVCYRSADVGGNSLFHVSYDPHSGWQYWRKKDKTAGIPYLPFLWMGMMLVGRNMLYGVY